MDTFASIPQFFPELEQDKLDQLSAYAAEFRTWNSQINLVSRKDIENFELHHLCHALALSKWLKLMPQNRVLDVGTGGGLPGIPLAILYPQTSFFLCDSILKKVKAVQAMVEALGLKNVQVVHKRAETLESKWDFILGRAVTNLPQFLGWIRKNIRRGHTEGLAHGVLYWKGSLYAEELGTIGLKPAHVYPLTQYLKDPYFEEKFIIHLKLS